MNTHKNGVPNWAPIPSLIPSPYAQRDWTVLQCESAKASVSVQGGQLNVPKVAVREDYLVRRHELTHIARSAETGGNVWTGSQLRVLFRKMLEEIAVETTCRLDIRQARDHLNWLSFPFPTDRPRIAAMVLQLINSEAQSANPDLQAYFHRLFTAPELTAADFRLLQEAWQAIDADPSHVNCECWADALMAHFDTPLPTPEAQGESQEAREAREQAAAEEAEAEAEAERAERQAGDDDQCAERRETDAASGGKLDIHMHTVARRGGRTIAAQWRASDLGTVVRRPELLVPSGRIFGRRAAGGSILIDYSGSMVWDPRVLVAAIGRLPRLWCAAYSGGTPSDPITGRFSTTRYVGRVCVVARNGRIGDWDERLERLTHMGANDVDADVLRYMVAQNPAGPYVWVSDGQVIGEGFPRRTYEHYAECDRLMARYGIVRVASLPAALDYLSGKPVDGWTTTGHPVHTDKPRRLHR